jgi:hypothetical protein
MAILRGLYARTLALGGALLLLGVVVLVVLLWPRPRAAPYPPACTHTTAPTGSVQSWLASAQPGQVLCLKAGTYTGGSNMLFVNSGQGGSESQPLWIRAETEGTVLIDGQFGQRPLDCLGHDVVFWGMNLKDGGDNVLVLRGTRCTVQRVVAWSTGNLMDVVDIGGSHNLLEDCGAFGYARKMIAVGARGGAGPNTVRRCWAEFNGFVPTPESGNPTHSFEAGYDQDTVTFENIIAHRDLLSSASDPQAPIVLFSTRNSQILGSIAYLRGGERFDTSQLMFIYPEGGSHEGSGHVNTNVLLKDIVTYVHHTFPAIAGFNIMGGRGGSANRADNLVGVDGAGASSNCAAEGWSCAQIRIGKTLAEALGPGTTVWDSVPGVCKRYVNRVLTTQGLWPWSMDARIDAALLSAGRPPVALTATMESLFGPIPAPCRTDTAPIPPEPIPPALTHLSCTGTIAQVPGAIALTCVPQSTGRR